MDNLKYKKIVKTHIKKKKNKIKYLFTSFIVGGLLGGISEVVFLLLTNMFNISSKSSMGIISVSIILTTSFLTSIGIFDRLITKYRSGLIIPTTGFAHSVSSSLIDYKKEGLITGLGSNVFLLAGSVILYSIVSTFILVIVKVIFFA